MPDFQKWIAALLGGPHTFCGHGGRSNDAPRALRANQANGHFDRTLAESHWSVIGDWYVLRRQTQLFPLLSIAQLAVLYSEHATTYFYKDGKPTSEVASVRVAIKPLVLLFRKLDVADFGPSRLRQYRQQLVDRGLTRYTVNKYVGRVVRMIRWAVSEEFCASSVRSALESVPRLRKGRSEAKESAGVKPVVPVDVAAIEGHIGRRTLGAVRFQLHTGCRPSEAIMIRPCDVDMSDDVWVYTPASHKTEHHGKSRSILIGPKAQAVVLEFLTTDTQAYLFSVEGTDRPYLRHTYTVAVRRACRRAEIPIGKPNQLRHTAATRIRKAANVETAKTALGHSDIRVTEIYAERDLESARAVIAKIG